MVGLILIPAVDIQNGTVVQLVQGDPTRIAISEPSPVATAKRWLAEGADWLHVVDLTRALGGPAEPAVLELAKLPARVQVGGGIRSSQSIGAVLDAGAKRVVVGTKAIEDPAWRQQIADEFGDQLVLAIDGRNGRVVVDGWRRETKFTCTEMARSALDLGFGAVLHTEVTVEGTMQGPATEEVRALTRTDIDVIASGGIGTDADLQSLADAGAWGAVAGMALYTGAIEFRGRI